MGFFKKTTAYKSPKIQEIQKMSKDETFSEMKEKKSYLLENYKNEYPENNIDLYDLRFVPIFPTQKISIPKPPLIDSF